MLLPYSFSVEELKCRCGVIFIGGLFSICTIIGCIITKEVCISIFVYIILFSTVIDAAFMFYGKEWHISSLFSYVFGCFSLIYAFFGNIYFNIIFCYICYSLMFYCLEIAVSEDIGFSIGGGISGFFACVTACIVVNMDWATWIEVIIWIIFGISVFYSYYWLLLFLFDD